MALQPVTGVTPLSKVNNVSFNGEHRRAGAGDGRVVSTSARAVPLAVLIAMSPLNKSVATDGGREIFSESPRTEVMESTGFLRPVNPLVKVIDRKNSDVFVTHERDKSIHYIYKFNKLSLDNNDNNFEALECIRYSPDGQSVASRFVIKQVDVWDVTELNDIKMLKLGAFNLNSENLNDYTTVDPVNRSYNYSLSSPAAQEILAHLKPIINSPKNNGAIKMKHYKGYGETDFSNDYIRQIKERQALLNVGGASSASTSVAVEKPTPVGDDLEIRNIRTGRRIFWFRKLNLDDNPNSYEALEMRYYVGGDVVERALLTEAAFSKNSSGKNVRILSGIKLPIDDLDSYEMGKMYKRAYTPEDENLGQVLENMLRGFAGAYANYGAFRIVDLSEALRASRSQYVKEKMNEFLSK